MALIGIVNFADRLVNQSQPPAPAAQNSPAANAPAAATNAPAKSPATATPANSSGSEASDEFTSSQQHTANTAAQAAGLFSVNTLSLFTAAAKRVLSATPTATENVATPVASVAAPVAAAAQNSAKVAAAPVATVAPVATAAPAAALNVSPVAAATQSSASAQNATPAQSAAAVAQSSAAAQNAAATQNSATPQLFAAAVTAGAAVAAPAPSANVSAFVPPPTVIQTATAASELQSLNSALSALGLSQADIAQVDRLASARDDYNPTTYSVLVHQLEVLAQTPKEQTIATPAAGAEKTNTAKA